MRNEQAQLLLTDPPYNIAISSIVSTKHREFAEASGEMSADEFATFLTDFLSASKSVMTDGAIGFVFMDWRQLELLLRAVRMREFELLNLIPWVKANAGMGSLYRSQHELIAMFKTSGTHKNRIELGARGRNRTNVWFAPGAGTMGSEAREMLGKHPTSKPVDMLADAIYDVTDPDDIVLDCFGGSGSTLIAAARTKRRARLIELDPVYCDLIIRRWQKETGKEALLELNGRSFPELEAERNAMIAGALLETIGPEETQTKRAAPPADPVIPQEQS